MVAMETVGVRLEIACATPEIARRLRDGERRALAEALYRAADQAATTVVPLEFVDELVAGAGGKARGSGRGWPDRALACLTFAAGIPFGAALYAIGAWLV